MVFSFIVWSDIVAKETYPLWMRLLFGMAMGGAIGSYIGCARWRWRVKRSMDGHSHCTHCGTVLKLHWNIPVFSWLALRGRTACCHNPLSSDYLRSEAISVSAGALLSFILVPPILAAASFAAIIVVAAAVQIHARKSKGLVDGWITPEEEQQALIDGYVSRHQDIEAGRTIHIQLRPEEVDILEAENSDGMTVVAPRSGWSVV